MGVGKGPRGALPPCLGGTLPELMVNRIHEGQMHRRAEGLALWLAKTHRLPRANQPLSRPRCPWKASHMPSPPGISRNPKVAGPPEERQRDADTSSPAFAPQLQGRELEIGEEAPKILSSARRGPGDRLGQPKPHPTSTAQMGKLRPSEGEGGSQSLSWPLAWGLLSHLDA